MKKFLTAAAVMIILLCTGFILVKTGVIALPENSSASAVKNSGFFYEQLSEKEKKVYARIMDKIYDFPEKIKVEYVDDDSLSKIFEAVLYDNNDTFFLGDTCEINNDFANSYFVPRYIMSKEEYAEKKQALDEAAQTILQGLPDTQDDYDKELYLHDYIVKNCDYVEGSDETYYSAYGCLIEKKALCEGYAKAMKLLLDKAGLENHYASGNFEQDGKSQGHIWNVVRVNGSYYHVDVTWDDPVGNTAEVRYTYFNLNDEELLLTHKPDERFLGLCVNKSENYYIKNDLYFDNYNDAAYSRIVSKLAQFADSGNNHFSFRFSNKEAYDKAVAQLFGNEKIYRVLTLANVKCEKTSIIQDKISYIPDDTHYLIRIMDYLKQ